MKSKYRKLYLKSCFYIIFQFYMMIFLAVMFALYFNCQGHLNSKKVVTKLVAVNSYLFNCKRGINHQQPQLFQKIISLPALLISDFVSFFFYFVLCSLVYKGFCNIHDIIILLLKTSWAVRKIKVWINLYPWSSVKLLIFHQYSNINWIWVRFSYPTYDQSFTYVETS